MTDTALPDTRVECHSGYTYAERPRAFIWEGMNVKIKAIAAEWQTPESKHFRVITKQGQTFELVYISIRDKWQIFQQEKTK